MSSAQKLKSQEVLTLRILTQKEADAKERQKEENREKCSSEDKLDPNRIKFELYSQDDIQFYYSMILTKNDYDDFRGERNGLEEEIDFHQFLPTLLMIIDECISKPRQFKIKFVLENNEGFANLKFLQDNEFMKNDLLVLDRFKQEPDDEKQNAQISHRISSMNQKTALIQQRLQELEELIRIQNPTLHQHMSRVVNGSLLQEEDSNQIRQKV